MATINFTYTDNTPEGDGAEVTEALPARWEICHVCEGDGKHSRDIGAITESERQNDWTPEEFDGYLAGAYDKTCDDCKGTGKALALDLNAITDPATLKDVKRQLRQTRRFAQERAHEIAMGY